MENEKLYLQPDMSVKTVSLKIGVNTTYLSQVINDVFHMNFNNYINEYRIKDARKMLTDPENTHLTIPAIVEKAGFKSRPSFNDAFKKYTGVTPSFYIWALKKKKK